ncbi:CHA4 (YLR098C) [Zygosaccharomyces parabailii]|nr:CHA4 (YLR098C) [Zygosaccharomyces parabailii]
MARRLACQNCRQKRKKCDLQLPCSRCARLRVTCVPTVQDMRKERSSNSYKKQLENHIAYLEKLLSEKTSPRQVAVSHLNPHHLHEEPNIRQSVALFFKWLYPNQFVFIYREAFLNAFLQKQKEGDQYISEELVYAVATLGASLTNRSDQLYARAQEYCEVAKEKVLAKIFGQSEASDKSSLSKLVLIQTLLCLAFYKIKTGNNELAWYFSGFAFRIVHEIGLHLHTSSWSLNKEDQEQRTSENLSQYDTEVRSRIYWGCYLADHLISQLFGRVTTLSLSNSTVPETDELPDTAGIEDFILCQQAEPIIVASPVRSLIVLSRITSWFINKIFIQSYILEERMENLTKFNAEIANWKTSLPEELQWSRASLLADSFYNPTVCYVWYHYYMALLSYNKPFVAESLESRRIIEESIQDLYLFLKNWEASWGSYEKCNLYTVYTAILAIQCYEAGNINRAHYNDFRAFLNSPDLNFVLPISLPDEHETNAMESLSLSNFFDTYNPDFSLLNEINTLLDIDGTPPI